MILPLRFTQIILAMTRENFNIFELPLAKNSSEEKEKSFRRMENYFSLFHPRWWSHKNAKQLCPEAKSQRSSSGGNESSSHPFEIKTPSRICQNAQAKGLISLFHMFPLLPAPTAHIFQAFLRFLSCSRAQLAKSLRDVDFKDQLLPHISRLYKH